MRGGRDLGHKSETQQYEEKPPHTINLQIEVANKRRLSGGCIFPLFAQPKIFSFPKYFHFSQFVSS